MRFSNEWKKLSWPLFTTIRKHPVKYEQGDIIPVNTPKQNFNTGSMDDNYRRGDDQ